MNSILVIRLGAMGDILHALPAVATLKKSFPASRLAWLVARRWMPLLAGNPFIDEFIPFERSGVLPVRDTWRRLRALEPDLAVDFQGLLQSALAGRMARPKQFFGFDKSVAREPLASLFYTCRVPVIGPHRIERNLQLIAATGATNIAHESWIPPGQPEGRLPSGLFILTSPFAGWKSKEWPLERYEALGQKLKQDGLSLVANVPEHRAAEVNKLAHVYVHTSGIAGLIDATRRATAVIGLDSGPLHLAAALRKPGVALFGPTDPACTGPYGGSMSVLRTAVVETTYKRGREIHASMTEITVEQVSEALTSVLSAVPRS
jgi:heptosyltransferase I